MRLAHLLLLNGYVTCCKKELYSLAYVRYFSYLYTYEKSKYKGTKNIRDTQDLSTYSAHFHFNEKARDFLRFLASKRCVRDSNS